jgi:hypothetical protein
VRNFNSRRRYPARTPQRIVAWWDVDVELGAFHKRKMTMRPLKALERMLGHRLHVEGWQHHHMTKGVYKFHAYHVLDTTDPDLAASFMLNGLSRVAQSVGNSWHAHNRAAALSDDLDESTIGAFYWQSAQQIGLPRFLSSGVLLYLVGAHSDDRRRAASLRPVVHIPRPAGALADYALDITIHIVCGNKQRLLELHLPDFLHARWPQGIEIVEIDARTHAGQPNIIRVRQEMRGVPEHKAIGCALALSPGFAIQLGRRHPFSFVGQRQPHAPYSDGIVSFELTRAPHKP